MCGASPARIRRFRFSRYSSDMRKFRANSLISWVALLGTPFLRPPPRLPLANGRPTGPVRTLNTPIPRLLCPRSPYERASGLVRYVRRVGPTWERSSGPTQLAPISGKKNGRYTHLGGANSGREEPNGGAGRAGRSRASGVRFDERAASPGSRG